MYRVILPRVAQMGAMSRPSLQSGISQSDRSYLCKMLSKVGVILAGVIFVKSYPDGSYPDEDGELTISSVGYEPTK